MKDVDRILVYPVIDDFYQITITVEAKQKMFIFSVLNRVFINEGFKSPQNIGFSNAVFERRPVKPNSSIHLKVNIPQKGAGNKRAMKNEKKSEK